MNDTIKRLISKASCKHEFRVVHNNSRFYYGYGYYCIYCLKEIDPYKDEEV